MAAMVAGGLLAGLIVRRTGSLLPVVLLHAALDLPLYYYFACRLAWAVASACRRCAPSSIR
jgi:membrane protease YdiL (CAAX protease family)